MDINSVMSTYNMNSIWNSINQLNSSSLSNVPLINNVNSSVQESYTAKNYFGQTTNTELQDIYQQVEPNYGIPFTYDQNGNFTMLADTTLPTDGLPLANSSIISLLNSNTSTINNLTENILSQYNSIENGTYTPNISSILSNNQYDIYSTINSLGNYHTQSASNLIDTTL